MKPTDTIEVAPLPHGTKLQRGDVWTFLDATDGDVATQAYHDAITLARGVFGPRWRAVSGPNLTAAAFEELVHRIVFEWLYFYAINKQPLVVTREDLAHPYAWRKVRSATGIALGPRTREANALAAQLLATDVGRYHWWVEQEDRMDEVR